jgi:uncharacterized protein
VFTKLGDSSKAAIFSVIVLVMAVGAALLIRLLELTSGMGMWVLWSFTPTAATLVMLLVVTREGYAREGWKGLGLHRLGLSVWWIAFGGTLLISVAASAVVWATPLASFVVPEGGIVDPLIGFLIQVVILALTFALGEEIGIRGYLLPRLLSLGRRRALFLSGLVWATWHMPLILLTAVFPVGNKVISLPLFYSTVVAASFFYGYLRLYTGSVCCARGAQLRVGRSGGVHSDLIPCDSSQVPGGGLRDIDPCWCRDRICTGWPPAREGRTGRAAAGYCARRSLCDVERGARRGSPAATCARQRYESAAERARKASGGRANEALDGSL